MEGVTYGCCSRSSGWHHVCTHVVTDVKGVGEKGGERDRKERFGGDPDGEEGGGEEWLRSRYTIHM